MYILFFSFYSSLSEGREKYALKKKTWENCSKFKKCFNKNAQLRQKFRINIKYKNMGKQTKYTNEVKNTEA